MEPSLKLILPKGRIQENVMTLLRRVGLDFRSSGRSLRPACSEPWIDAKILKPQNIPALVDLGRHDCGFTGYDWVVEQHADVEEILDLGFNPVRIIAAVPESLAEDGAWRKQKLVVASEYANMAKTFIRLRSLDAVFVQSFGATEALPPDDADLIVDNTETGATLRQNRLVVVDEIMQSTTRFIANPKALEDPFKSRKIEELKKLMEATILAKEKVLLEMNVSAECFDRLVADLPCMRSPTVAPLHNEEGFAVKIAVSAKDVPSLIPRLIEAGARDILEYKLQKIVV